MITEGEKGVGKIKSGVLQGSWAIMADWLEVLECHSLYD